MASNEYVNIGLAILAVIILLFLIGSYYNSSYDERQPHSHQERQESRHQRNDDHRGRNRGQQAGNYHQTQNRREGFNTPQQLAQVQQNAVKPEPTTNHSPNIGDNSVSNHIPDSPVNTAPVEGQPSTGSVLKKRTSHSLGGFPKDPYPKDTLLSPNELLPQDDNNTWNSSCPKVNGSLENKNFLEAGYHIGVNTIGQTLRNPNLQLRSEPPCPTTKVSPWQQSTIDPDLNRRSMEIGSC